MAESHARVQAVVVERIPFAPPSGASQLALALREDLGEMISALRLRAGPGGDDGPALAQAAARGPLLLLFSDVPALPPLAVDAAVDALAQVDVALGPCADGSLYMLGLRAGIAPALVQELLGLAPAPDALGAITDLLDDAELQVAVLPPWFRLASAPELSFAECLARLSLMSEEGEDDFVADRLRVWFEQFAPEA